MGRSLETLNVKAENIKPHPAANVKIFPEIIWGKTAKNDGTARAPAV